ncbi:MAG: T9SS type A sorting domain-containing protein, partial [Bacteroidota bacterium]
GEFTRTIDTAPSFDKTMVYYSIENDQVLDLEPDSWDVVFCRYQTVLQDGIDYFLTGVLSNAGVEVAEGRDVMDPQTENESDYQNEYSTDLDVIGWDWKTFTGSWSVPDDVVYFVRSHTDSLWRVQFVDFTGSSLGESTYLLTYEGLLTNLEEPNPQFETFAVFPNPATDQLTVSFDAKDVDNNAQIVIYNNVGQLVYQAETGVDPGLNVRTIPLNLSNGMYQLQVQSLEGVITRPFIVQR